MTHGQAQPLGDPTPGEVDFRMSEEVRSAWYRGGVVNEGERIDGFVTVLRAVGYDPDGHEYSRVCRIVPPGTHRGDARDLLLEGLRLGPTAVRSEPPDPPVPA